MKHNKTRQNNFERASREKLKQIAASGSLSSACASYWLWARFKEVAPTEGQIAWANSAIAKQIAERQSAMKKAA